MKKILILMITMLTFSSASVASSEPSVEEIVQKANLAAYYAGDDGRARVSMTITDDQGRTRKREFVILRWDKTDGGEQKFYVYFERPSDVRKMVFMVHKSVSADDNRWLYLPALDLVKRIAASDKRTSFVGSHFLYEDVSGRALREDTHELIETTDAYYVIKNIPKEPENVEFSSYTMWIDKKTFMPMKAEYFDRQGKKYRLVEALKVENIDGFPTVVQSKVTDLSNGGSTLSEFKDIKYNIGLKENIFSERYLRRAPREVRR